MNTFESLLESNAYIMADGAMGTFLMAAGLERGQSPVEWNVSHPDKVRAEYSIIETIASATAGLNDRDDRTLYRIVPRVSWRWAREWEIAGHYEYAKKDEDNDPKDATRNAVYLTLTYRPDKIYISR